MLIIQNKIPRILSIYILQMIFKFVYVNIYVRYMYKLQIKIFESSAQYRNEITIFWSIWIVRQKKATVCKKRKKMKFFAHVYHRINKRTFYCFTWKYFVFHRCFFLSYLYFLFVVFSSFCQNARTLLIIRIE